MNLYKRRLLNETEHLMPDSMMEVCDQSADLVRQAAARVMDVGELIVCASELRSAGRKASGVALYKAWIAHNPDNPLLHAVYFNYGVAISELDDLIGAAIVFREAIRLKPDFCPPYINLGSIQERLGHPDRAILEWTKLVSLSPALNGDAIVHKTTALKQMARILESAGHDATAEQFLAQSLDLDPDQGDVIQHLISLRQRQCEWPVIKALPRVSAQRLTGEMSPLSAACYTDDPLFHLAVAHRYNRRWVGLPNHSDLVESPPRKRHSTGKLRIGYVSSDLRGHAVGYGMTEVIELHDRQNFEVFAYYCGIRREDKVQIRIRNAVDGWADLNDMDDRQAAQTIASHDIDILVDLNGYTKDARTGIFALRPAPIAVNWFGFPGTMGSPYHHYLIADEHTIPQSHELYYSERIVRLPCYQPNDRHRIVAQNCPSRRDVGLPDDGMVYCCLNGVQKLTRSTFGRWMTILQQVPNSVLWLLSANPGTDERIRQLATGCDIAAERIIFAERMDNPSHVARYALADLFLDTIPYGAHTTAADALWMGVPVLTWFGRSFASRVCGSLVRAAGLEQLVVGSAEEYIRLAIELGHDRQRLAEIKQALIAGRDRSLLFDTPLLVRHLEDVFRRIWDEFLRGERPRPDLRNLEVYHEFAVEGDLVASESMSNAVYLAGYRQRLADRDIVTPLEYDGRLWCP